LRSYTCGLIAALLLIVSNSCNRPQEGWSKISLEGLEPRVRYLPEAEASCWLEIQRDSADPYARLLTVNQRVVAQLLDHPYIYMKREGAAPLCFKLTALKGNQVWTLTAGFVRQVVAELQKGRELTLYYRSGGACMEIVDDRFEEAWEGFLAHSSNATEP